MSARAICQARVMSREFGAGPCGNWAKDERYGLHVCNIHKKLVDRLALGHGEEYALSVVWLEWGRREAAFPRLRVDHSGDRIRQQVKSEA